MNEDRVKIIDNKLTIPLMPKNKFLMDTINDSKPEYIGDFEFFRLTLKQEFVQKNQIDNSFISNDDYDNFEIMVM